MIKISNIYSDEDRTIEIVGRKFHWPFPIAFMLYGSGATIFGFQVYGNGKRPFIKWIYKLFKGIADIQYKLMYRFCKEHQYHIIYTELGYGYHCSDTRILYGAMKCLEDYVEAEKHGGEAGLAEQMHTSPDSNGLTTNYINSETEALAIYRWWKYERTKNHEKHNDLFQDAFGKSIQESKLRNAYHALSEKLDNDDQEYLHKLINIRQTLWI